MRWIFFIPLFMLTIMGITGNVNAQSDQQQRIFLWEGGKIPAITKFTESGNSRYMDPPGFRPDMLEVPVKQDTMVKGAVILCGELLLNFDGTVKGTSIDPNYLPDQLDKVSADASAVGMVYSFYGRLSVASTDVEKFKASDLPPSYFVYGTRDPFVNQFELCVNALQQAGVPVESHPLEGWPHGFGAGDGKWIIDFDKWLMGIFGK